MVPNFRLVLHEFSGFGWRCWGSEGLGASVLGVLGVLGSVRGWDHLGMLGFRGFEVRVIVF